MNGMSNHDKPLQPKLLSRQLDVGNGLGDAEGNTIAASRTGHEPPLRDVRAS